MKLTIAYLYPAEMNIYGDRGNILTLYQRLRWRGIEADVARVGIGDKYDLRGADIIFAGGGQDRGQIPVSQDLQQRADNIHEAISDGVVALTICGTYQLFGKRFITKDGREIPGIGVFKAETRGSTKRMIGNTLVDTAFGPMVGFENHSGQTYLEDGQAPLGAARKGYGNNGEDGTEGAIQGSAYGTYMHGPLLPKNPNFTDHLLLQALRRKYEIEDLPALDDRLERAAAAAASKRPQ